MGSIEDLLTRVRGEFLEMPGLCLTQQQACRLWQMDELTCDGVLGALVEAGFLTRTPAGAFVAPSCLTRNVFVGTVAAMPGI